jgi:hypothetical protein
MWDGKVLFVNDVGFPLCQGTPLSTGQKRLFQLHPNPPAHSHNGQLPLLSFSLSPLCLACRGFANIREQEGEGGNNSKDKKKLAFLALFLFP